MIGELKTIDEEAELLDQTNQDLVKEPSQDLVKEPSQDLVKEPSQVSSPSYPSLMMTLQTKQVKKQTANIVVNDITLPVDIDTGDSAVPAILQSPPQNLKPLLRVNPNMITWI